MKWEERKTPPSFIKYGKGFDSTIKMWQVQKGDIAKLGYGLINTGAAFEDTPDAEYISGGDHTKMPNCVAIGRHANFFHWGYSASPKYMTGQAKQVFVNSLHYIAKFKGQKILAKRVNRQWVSYWAKDKPTYDYKHSYEDNVKFLTGMNDKIKAVKAKKARGEELSRADKFVVNRPLSKIPSFEEFLAQRERKLFPKYGTDISKYHAYYKKYLKYMRPAKKDVRFSMVDMDAFNFGIPFSDKKFLPACIKALKDAAKKDLALKLLKRYTNESFETAKDWKKWYKKNKKKLFFTEACGFKYIVNTL